MDVSPYQSIRLRNNKRFNNSLNQAARWRKKIKSSKPQSFQDMSMQGRADNNGNL